MKKETKIIIGGIIITLLILVLTFFIFYFIYNHKSQEDKQVISNQDYSTNIDNNSSSENLNNDSNQSEKDPANTEEKQITVYLFRGEGCHFCENAIEFLKSIMNNYSYLEIKTYEVWKNQENEELMHLVSQKLNIEIKNSVPLIIIGNNYAKRGFADGMKEGIKKEIETSYQNAEYQDIIKQILKENPNLKVEEELLNKND